MTLHDYLSTKLSSPWVYSLSEEDEKALRIEGVEKFIFRKLKSKRFRKTRLDEDSAQRVQDAISINVEKGEPIKFTYPFGGYKIWRVPSYPTVDWAEFFTISYVLEYIAPVLAAYKPGVDITFSSDDIIIELIDNYPRKDLDAYVKSFRDLVTKFSKYFPNNLHLSLQRVADLYSLAEYKEELENNYKQFKSEGLTDERIGSDYKYSEFNFQIDGKEDFSAKSKEDLNEYKLDLMYWSQAYLQLSKRRSFVRGEDKVVLFSQPISKAIDIGSTQTSKAKFWAGTGVVECVEGRFFERILSPKQFAEVQNKGEELALDLIGMNNFKNILQFKERLNFLNN